jgi:two-component system invasion response regulator UvrY
VSPGLAERLAADLADGARDARHELLSDREYEVLCLLGSGRTVKEIARSLQLSPKTVSTYRTRVLDKMRASSNADLVRYAALHGLMR